MSRPDVHGAGDDGGGQDNPAVTSKFDRDGGMPRTPGKVGSPGGTAEPTFAHTRAAPTSASTHPGHGGKVHTYAPNHPAMGGLEHGTRAIHPTHDSAQAAREKAGGYHGTRGK